MGGVGGRAGWGGARLLRMRGMSSVDRLIQILRQLRDPEHGCPWDVEQDFASIAPYTIEEAYEVEDAIRRGDRAELRDELGGLGTRKEFLVDSGHVLE